MNQVNVLEAAPVDLIAVADVRPTPARPAESRLKRGLDLALALIALVILSPLLALVAVAIWLEDGQTVLFMQDRTGLNGAPFSIYKFRTMTVAENGDQVTQATRGDRRITRVGALLRALSIDELPQLLNVARGDMSLIGPRPHALAHDNAWAAITPNYAGRFRTRPGLTGYAQVQGHRGEIRRHEDLVKRIEADNHYIDNWSLALELQILLRTLPLLVHDPRAY